MRGLVAAASLAIVWSAAPVLSQQPAQPTPAPSGQKPAAPAPAPPPAGQKPAVPAPAPTAQPSQVPPQPPAPFPQGAKIAYVNLQVIAQMSADGKAAATKVNALTQKKQSEIAEKQKALQAAQQKLQTGGTVMSDQARAQLEKEIERQTRDLERFQQDAQAELSELQQDLQGEFQKKLIPILEQISKEKGLHALFSAADAGLIWAEPGVDLTLEAVKRLDGATAAPAPKP